VAHAEQEEPHSPVVSATGLVRSIRVVAIANSFTAALGRREILKLTKSAPGREELGSHASKVADRAFHGGAKTEATGKIRQGCPLPQDRLMQLPSSLQSQRLRGWVIARLALEPPKLEVPVARVRPLHSAQWHPEK
jgi:hypothetical protein